MKEDNHEMVKMKATQLPVISNQATPGHKLQGASNRNMSKSKGWTLQSSLLTLWMETTRVNNQTKIDDNVNLLKTLLCNNQTGPDCFYMGNTSRGAQQMKCVGNTVVF